MQAIDCDAKASFNSIRSRSVVFIPALANAFLLAGTGPIPIIEGSTPATAILFIFAMGTRPNFNIAASLANNIAAAPSFMPEEFPAVTVPSFAKAGFSCPSFSMLDKRGCSSLSKSKTLAPICTCNGIISSAHLFAANALAYFFWLAMANSSCALRLMFHCRATFSAVSPILYG